MEANVVAENSGIITKKEQVYNYIKKEIISGRLKPGDWIQEKEIAETLNVSRSPVRESLKELSVEGLTVNIPNKGVYVRKLTPSDVIDIYEIRCLMEKYAIQKIINRLKTGTEEEKKGIMDKLDEIKKQFKKYYETFDVHNYARIDAKFHMSLMELSSNEHAYKLFEKSFQNIQTFQIIPLENEKRFKDSYVEHSKTIENIQKKDFDKSWEWDSTNLKLAFQRTLKVVKKISTGYEENNNDDHGVEISCDNLEKIIKQ